MAMKIPLTFKLDGIDILCDTLEEYGALHEHWSEMQIKKLFPQNEPEYYI